MKTLEKVNATYKIDGNKVIFTFPSAKDARAYIKKNSGFASGGRQWYDQVGFAHFSWVVGSCEIVGTSNHHPPHRIVEFVEDGLKR